MAHYGVLIRVVGVKERKDAETIGQTIVDINSQGGEEYIGFSTISISLALRFLTGEEMSDEKIDTFMDIREADASSIGKEIVENQYDNGFRDYAQDHIDEETDIQECRSAFYDPARRELRMELRSASQGQWDYGSNPKSSWTNGLNPPDYYRFVPGKTKDCDVAGLIANENQMAASTTVGGRPIGKALFSYFFIAGPEGNRLQFDRVEDILLGGDFGFPSYKDAKDDDWLLVFSVHM